ncbi:hypothetical protein DL89DRAFT_31429 [Linderina pennispora]|uniref:Uncharacterized protein n=1 Tax=Linderina pennispora TaxID=61395 RepID=A0A1Y1W435_9FUNG|nr:uncharacterized protein DL89DRAFT_31429 [Linderina pennispora]ORX68330.1 hypothetical protein DL89DRAFT_31429 [Linderina pennispora]
MTAVSNSHAAVNSCMVSIERSRSWQRELSCAQFSACSISHSRSHVNVWNAATDSAVRSRTACDRHIDRLIICPRPAFGNAEMLLRISSRAELASWLLNAGHGSRNDCSGLRLPLHSTRLQQAVPAAGCPFLLVGRLLSGHRAASTRSPRHSGICCCSIRWLPWRSSGQ